MTIGAYHIALCNLFKEPFLGEGRTDHSRDVSELLTPDMIKLKNNGICFAAVNTRLAGQIFTNNPVGPVSVLNVVPTLLLLLLSGKSAISRSALLVPAVAAIITTPPKCLVAEIESRLRKTLQTDST